MSKSISNSNSKQQWARAISNQQSAIANGNGQEQIAKAWQKKIPKQIMRMSKEH